MESQYLQAVNALSGLGDEGFIHRAYKTLLGRFPDPGGLRGYVMRLQSGAPRLAIWCELADSEEAKRYRARKPVTGMSVASVPTALSLGELMNTNGAEFVRNAYRSVLGREADATGLKAYTQRMMAGDTKIQIVVDMYCDPEGRLYDADLVGLDILVRLMRQQTVAYDLLNLYGDLFVRAAYAVVLKREPDPGGLARYIRVLKSGYSRSYILSELLNSQEAREKAESGKGLTEAVSLYRKAQRKTWHGWYCRSILGAESDFPAARERRALAGQLR